MKFNLLNKITKNKNKDAFRLALQSALAGAICYYLMILFEIPERFVGVLSAVLVIEPSIGNTFQQAKGRVLSTIVGVLIGFVFVALIPWELGVILSLLFSLFIISGISSFKPEWRYGVVGAVALALGSEGDAFNLALERVTSIAFGVIVGIIISLIIWPNTAEKRALNYLNKALENTLSRFKIEFKNTRDKNNKQADSESNEFHKNIKKARETSDSITFKKNKNLNKIINNTEILYNSITIIKRVAEKSSSNITDGNAGIKNDSEKVIRKASEIIKKFVENKKVENSELQNFANLIKETKTNIQIKVEDKDITILRNTFLFALTEIKESIEKLNKNFKDYKN